MNARCNLPETEREAAFAQFRGCLTAEEESTLRGLFPQYLFFRNEYEDNGWDIGPGPERMCTCTACGETFTAVRGNYARGKLHNEECNCPVCGARVTGKAVYKFRYEMHSLEGWIKTAAAYTGEDGALLIEAGEARRRFNWDELRGDLEWFPEKRYWFGRGKVQMWENAMSWACGREEWERRWVPCQRVKDPFAPQVMNCGDYYGDYNVIGLQEALEASALRYCQIMDFYEYEYAAKLWELDTARWIVKYLAWAALHPQIEMAVKFGLTDAVQDLTERGKENRRLLNWDAGTPHEFLRMSKPDARLFLKAGMSFRDLQEIRSAGKMPLRRYLELNEAVRGSCNLREISACSKAAGCSLEKAVRYVLGQMPRCARNAPPLSEIIRTWKDYLHMAKELEYDLKEQTVAMPKDLKDRHDAAAAVIRHNADEREQKRYRKRRKLLEKKYAFTLDGLSIVIPAGAAEIVEEGKTLHHCVGGYAARHVAGATTILFLRHSRKPGRSFLTIEIWEDKGKTAIRQIHGYKNENIAPGKRNAAPGERYKWFLDVWLDWVNEGSPRDKDGQAIITEKEMAV